MQRVWPKASPILIIMILVFVSVYGYFHHKEDKLRPERFFSGQMLKLARAISAGDTDQIRTLIRSGADPNTIGKEGVTPLIYAYARGQKKAMVTLLENGADPNLRINSPLAAPTMANRSAVTIVAGTPDNEYLEILLDHGGDINAKDSDKEPILISMIYVEPENYAGIEMLLNRGANMEVTDSAGDTLLKHLALLADFEHVYYLLQRGADFRRKNPLGFDISADVFNYKIDKDQFPEGYAWQQKCKEFLLAHGVKDPGPLKPREQTAEEQAEWQRLYNEAREKDRRRYGY